ncbi:MAG: hypothetical protein H0W84_04345 [Bacteroidetes bacterium]|nr:hypothetical protein [Bacteroidota bacterium]
MNNPGNSSKVSPAGINYLNMGLMLISVVAAYILPFEVFLFSYAVLGPLHYLTEISWLEKKNYFVKSKKDIWLFVILVILITSGMFDTTAKTNLFVASFLFSGFVYALIILFVEKTGVKLLLVFLTFMVSVIFNFNTYPDFPFMLFAIWLPTIIHVFFFTGAFILLGALKSRSVSGIISLLVFIACAFAFFIYMPENFGIPISDYGRKAYSYFRVLNTSLYNAVGFGNLQTNDENLYVGTKAVAVMRFIAFAYTYHYLNWFSKTTVIKWNQVSKTRLIVIIALWLLAVGLYAFSYEVGFYALFLLSMLHVFFEFPLNHQTFIGIGKEIMAMVRK